MGNNKTENPQQPVKRPAAELSTTGKVVVAMIVVFIGLGILRVYRTQCLEDAAQNTGYGWQPELAISRSN